MVSLPLESMQNPTLLINLLMKGVLLVICQQKNTITNGQESSCSHNINTQNIKDSLAYSNPTHFLSCEVCAFFQCENSEGKKQKKKDLKNYQTGFSSASKMDEMLLILITEYTIILIHAFTF